MSARRRAAGAPARGRAARPATVGPGGRREVRSDAVLLDGCSRGGELDVFGVGGQAVGSWDVGDEHGGEGGCLSAGKVRDGEVGLVERSVSLAGSARDFDRCAVHVHLTVADLVEPGPREGVCSWSDACRNGKTVGIRVRSRGGVVCSKVACHVLSRATSLDRVNDHPFRALRCRCIGSKRDLTRSTAMHRFAQEGERLRGADSHVGDGATRIARGFAWEV